MDLRVLLSYARPYRLSLAFCILLMIVETAAGLAVPWVGGQFAAGVLSAKPDVNSLSLILLTLFAAQALLTFSSGYLLSLTSQRILADLRIRIYDHLQALPLSFYQERRQGDILALMTFEVSQLSGFITGTILKVIPSLLTVAGSLVLMFRIEPLFALLAAILVPLFFLVLKIMGRRLKPLATQLQQAQATVMAAAEEDLGMLPAIKTFTREAEQSRRYKQHIHDVMKLSTTQQRIYSALEPTVQFIAATAVVLLLWLATARLNNNTMTPSELVSFLLYAALLTRPVSSLAAIYGQTKLMSGTLSRMQEVLTERPEPLFGGEQNLTAERGEIEFRHVGFAYPGRAAALEGIDLYIRAGETIAITGKNGAGKSTLAHLLMRLHEPCEGQILIDGTDIQSVSLHSLRSQIGVVPQHVLLFNGSVSENIGYGKTNATYADIERAARGAQAHQFICDLPQGYETLIGDQGIRLSGGQRQRIALARALIKDPLILVLDEATSMFDPQGEKYFIEQCHQVLAQRTVILITHRPASLALANRVVKLEAGKIMLPQHESGQS